MHIVVLLILAIIWAAVLIPPALRARSELSPVDSIGAFQRQLSVIERARPVAPGTPAQLRPYHSARHLSRQQALQRRRTVFFALLTAIPATLVASVLVGGLVWLSHLAVDLAFSGYVAMLIRARTLAEEREMKVRFLPTAVPAAELALRRTTVN